MKHNFYTCIVMIVITLIIMLAGCANNTDNDLSSIKYRPEVLETFINDNKDIYKKVSSEQSVKNYNFKTYVNTITKQIYILDYDKGEIILLKDDNGEPILYK